MTGSEITLTLPGFIDEATRMCILVKIEPRGKGRPRAFVNKATGRADAHPDKQSSDWEKSFQILALAAERRLADQIKMIAGRPLFVHLTLEYAKPKKCSWFCTKPIDNDNAEKLVWDAMQGRFFMNDNRIVANFTTKTWAEGDPRIVIHIAALKEFP